MKTNIIKNMTLALTLLFVSSLGFSQSTTMQKPLAGVDDTKQYNTIDLIYMDKDFSIFANLLTLSGLDTSLSMTDRAHTLFIPTNEAFKNMTIENFAKLTNPKNRAMLVKFVNRHFTGSKIDSRELTEFKVFNLDNNNRINVSNVGNSIVVGGSTVIAADIETANGVVHVVDNVINIAK